MKMFWNLHKVSISQPVQHKDMQKRTNCETRDNIYRRIFSIVATAAVAPSLKRSHKKYGQSCTCRDAIEYTMLYGWKFAKSKKVIKVDQNMKGRIFLQFDLPSYFHPRWSTFTFLPYLCNHVTHVAVYVPSDEKTPKCEIFPENIVPFDTENIVTFDIFWRIHNVWGASFSAILEIALRD